MLDEHGALCFNHDGTVHHGLTPIGLGNETTVVEAAIHYVACTITIPQRSLRLLHQDQKHRKVVAVAVLIRITHEGA